MGNDQGRHLKAGARSHHKQFFIMAARAHGKNTIIIISWAIYHIQAIHLSSSMFLL